MNELPTLDELTQAIDDLLGLEAVGQLLQLNSSSCGHAYEAYVLALCVRAVRKAEGTAILRGIVSGPDPELVIFRGGPGPMHSRAQDFCYVECEVAEKKFEIHVDVKYEGRSGASHEIDVSFCSSAHARAVRRDEISPRANGKNLLVAIECKFYDSTPGVVLALTFVGLLTDCFPRLLSVFAANKSSFGLDRFLGADRKLQPFTDVTSFTPETEQRFICYLEQTLRKWKNTR